MPLECGRLDWARIAACLSVIGIHSAYAARVPVVDRVCFWALPFFFLASGFLSGERLTRTGWTRARLLHLVGILLPWLILGRIITFIDSGLHYGPADLVGDLLLGSGWGHLWFLPALIMITAAAWAALRFRLRRMALIAGAVLALAVLVAMTQVEYRWSDLLYRSPFYWFFFFMLGAGWRGSPGRTAGDGAASRVGAAWAGAASGAAGIAGVALQVGAGWLPAAWERSAYLLGSGLVAIAVARWVLVPAERTPVARRLAGATLGVYVTHYFLIGAFRTWLPWLVDRIVLLWLVTAVVSFGVVLLLMKIPGVRRLVS